MLSFMKGTNMIKTRLSHRLVTLAVLVALVSVSSLNTAYGGNSYEVRDIKVVDGDTIDCTIVVKVVSTFFGTIIRTYHELPNQRIRILELDTWEAALIKRNNIQVTKEEVAKGKKATLALHELLKDNQVEIEESDRKNEKYDVYGRKLAHVYVFKLMRVDPDGHKHITRVKVADWMKDHGHSRVGN